MADHNSSASNVARAASVNAAFLLGWSISETLGLFRKGTRPLPKRAARPPDYAPRLVVSQGFMERSTDAVIVAVERVVRLYQALGFEPDLDSEPLTQQMLALPQKTREWVDGKSAEFYTPRDLRKLLNDWSLEVWARLGGVSADTAQAFTAGMSLADTYWYLRLPRQRPKEPAHLSEEDWRRLLSKYRLDVEQSRLRRLEGKFPPYVIPVIRRHLQLWSIGTEVGYRGKHLVRNANGDEKGALKPEDETKIQQALARQVLFWNAMLFGFREAATYLHTRDRVTIQIVSAVGFLLALVVSSALLIAALAALGYFLIVAVMPLVQPVLSPFLAQQQLKISDLISFANLAWTLLVALRLPLLVGVAYTAAYRAQKWIDDRLTVRLIAQRTYVPWDRYLKG